MNAYHVATFDHERAAQTLFDDLKSLQVENVTFKTVLRAGKSDGGQVWVKVPFDVSLAVHLTAVKNFSLGRGSHVVTREFD